MAEPEDYTPPAAARLEPYGIEEPRWRARSAPPVRYNSFFPTMAFIPRCWSRVLLALVLVSSASGQTKKPTPPNVVVITVDTLRADHLGCYGYKQIKKPIID